MIRRLIFVARMLFWTFIYWPVKKWIGFWFGSITNISLNGYPINVRPGRGVAKIADLAMAWEVFIDNVYDAFEIGEHDVVFDIGGHIGSFTTKAARKCIHGQVFSFEPTPETFSILNQNVKDLKNVKAFRIAISDHSGTEQIYLSDNNPAENSLFRKTDKQIDVELMTLHDFFSKYEVNRVNLMKLDCEGAEYQIITSSINELKNKVEKIVMEVHEPKYFNIPVHHTIQSLIEIMQTNGFKVNFRRDNQYQGYIYAENRNIGVINNNQTSQN